MSKILEVQVENPLGLVMIAFVLGCFLAVICSKTSKCTRNMIVSLAILPSLVTAALLAVNGNMGASIAVLGVFGLVRFRSVAGTSRDIINVFFAMASGLLVSTGYIFVAIFLTLLVGILLFASTRVVFQKYSDDYELKILVPEDLDFTETYQVLLWRYFNEFHLNRVKTTNMGSLFELTYYVSPKEGLNVKEMMDDIRTHNGNLNVVYSRCDQGLENL